MFYLLLALTVLLDHRAARCCSRCLPPSTGTSGGTELPVPTAQILIERLLEHVLDGGIVLCRELIEPLHHRADPDMGQICRGLG